MKSKVVLLACDNYNPDNVYEKIKKGFELLGGVSKFVKSDDKVLLKVNMLEGADSIKAITTNPAILDSVVRVLKEQEIKDIKYGDSPGSPLHNINQSLKLCGFLDVAEKYDIEYGNFKEHKKVSYEEGKVAKSFELCNAIMDADKIIEICKMKTHALENITGAVKNQYGCIYGAYKAKGHKDYPSSSKFAEMLVDLSDTPTA